jgi:hypothetical protein
MLKSPLHPSFWGPPSLLLGGHRIGAAVTAIAGTACDAGEVLLLVKTCNKKLSLTPKLRGKRPTNQKAFGDTQFSDKTMFFEPGV